VLWVNSAIAAAQARLAHLGDPSGDPQDLGRTQDLLRILQLRRKRASESLGASFVRR